MTALIVITPELLYRSYTYVRLTRSLLAEYHCTVYQREEGVILTHTYILTWIVNSTTLTNDNVACLSYLTTIKLNAESFAL